MTALFQLHPTCVVESLEGVVLEVVNDPESVRPLCRTDPPHPPDHAVVETARNPIVKEQLEWGKECIRNELYGGDRNHLEKWNSKLRIISKLRRQMPHEESFRKSLCTYCFHELVKKLF